MIVRSALAVVLATALLAASYPALDDARRDHTASTVGSELGAVERAAERLVATDDAVPGAGARRIVSLRLPQASWGDAGVERVEVGPAEAGCGGLFTWTVSGGARHERRLPDLALRTPDGDPVAFSTPGRHRVVLALDGTPTEPVVTVREFKAGDGTSTPHATVASRS